MNLIRAPLGSFLGWAMALLCLVMAPFQIAAQEVGLQPITLHVGFTRASFRIVNASDATAAFRVFAQTAGRKRGYALDTDAQVFDNSAACEAEIKKGAINMAILDSWDFLGMDIHQVMEPVFVSKEQGSFFKEYLLLVHRDSGLTRLADLRGKELMVLEGKGGSLSRAWLDSLLLEQHLGAKETFFSKLEPTFKSSSAVLPVFFGAKPVCMVDRSGFQVMSELNPQVGSNLVILAVSEPYVATITCLSKSGWNSARARQDVIDAIAELHLEPNGRQVLTMFKLEQVVPFKEEYLDSARKLRATVEIPGKKNAASLPNAQTHSEP